MAKKKTGTASRTTTKLSRRLPSAKKKSSKSSAKKKRVKKKSTSKARKPVASKGSKTSSKKKSANSVDGILKKFVQEKSSLDLHLEALDKKIDNLEKKTKLYQEQLVSLGQDKEATLDSIAKIDMRRDLEVSELLAKLGIKVTDVAPPVSTASTKSTTTVVIDVKSSKDSDSDHDDHNGNGDASYFGAAEAQD